MNARKQRTVLGVVLGLAGTALALDRLVLQTGLTSPQAASAHEGDDSSGELVSTQGRPRATPLLSQLADRINAGLESALPSPEVDPFRPLIIDAPAQAAEVRADAQAEAVKLVQAFESEHSLRIVMRAGDDPRNWSVLVHARSEGKGKGDADRLRLGQELKGWVLAEIRDREAVFVREGQSATLRIDPAGVSPSQSAQADAGSITR